MRRITRTEQRAGKPQKVRAALSMQAPIGVGGSAPRARPARWQDRASRRARAEQLKREPHCRLCAAEGKTVQAVEVDHITPRHAGGSLTDPNNLRSVCHDHHVDVTLDDRAKRTGRPVRRRRKVAIDPATGLPLPGQDHWWSEVVPDCGK